MRGFGEFRAAILSALTPELARAGFAFRPALERFVRKAGKGVTHFYHVLITESQPFARVDVHLALRLDAVEDIFHGTSGYEKKYQRWTPTMGGALDAITGNPEFKMLVERESGPQQAKSLLLSPAMLAFYEDWHSRLSKLENIDRELNDDPLRETPNRPMPWLRCSTGIIVASLTARADYDALAHTYTEVMRGFSNGFYLPRFELLLDELPKEMNSRGGKP
jgi:hypothetical protein